MITAADVRHIAKLAKLSLTDAEVETYTRQLAGALSHFEILQALDVAGVPPSPRPLPLSNVWRDDEVTGDLDQETALAAAPEREGPYFKVPKIIG